MFDNFKKWKCSLITILLIVMLFCFVSGFLLVLHINPLAFWNTIFKEPLTNIISFSNLVQTFSVLLLAGLAVAITFKYHIYNFGVSGQMMFSAMITYIIAVAIADSGGNSQWITPFLLLVAVLVGAICGFIVAILKTYFKIHEVISTILFNFIAWQGYKGLVSSPFYHNLKVPTEITNLRFSLIGGPFNISNLFSGAIIIALLVLIIAVIVFNNRTIGFKLNVIAKNPLAAKQARLNPQYQGLVILPISAAIAGLAGYLYFLGLNNNLPTLAAPIQEGFYGIMIAALVNYEPVLILFSTFGMSLFISPLHFNAFIYLENPQVAVIILAIMVYVIGTYPFLSQFLTHVSFFKIYWSKQQDNNVMKNDKQLSYKKKKKQVVHLRINSKRPPAKPKWWKWKRFKKKEENKNGS